MTDQTLHPLCRTSDLKPGKMKRYSIAGEAILLCNVDGQFHAVQDMCTHEDASLYLGCLKGSEVQCSLHGGRFDVVTGEATVEPAEHSLKTWKTLIRDGEVFLQT